MSSVSNRWRGGGKGLFMKFNWCEKKEEENIWTTNRYLLLFSSTLFWHDLKTAMEPKFSREYFSPSAGADAAMGLIEELRSIHRPILSSVSWPGFQDDPDIKVMLKGSTLRKVKSSSWKKRRFFRLLEDGLTLWYRSRWAGRHSSCEWTRVYTCLTECLSSLEQSWFW